MRRWHAHSLPHTHTHTQLASLTHTLVFRLSWDRKASNLIPPSTHGQKLRKTPVKLMSVAVSFSSAGGEVQSDLRRSRGADGGSAAHMYMAHTQTRTHTQTRAHTHTHIFWSTDVCRCISSRFSSAVPLLLLYVRLKAGVIWVRCSGFTGSSRACGG